MVSRSFQFVLAIVMVVLLAGCGGGLTSFSGAGDAKAVPPDRIFFVLMKSMCGKSFEGTLTSTDPRDATFAQERIVMHVRDCEKDVIRIPLHVGDDRSRTWVITRLPRGLRLKHDHRHEDGTADEVTLYGGDTLSTGTTRRQEFPADAYSKAMFRRTGLDASVENVWSLELLVGDMFAYELRRPDRLFRVEFDLDKPVATPPPAWGAALRTSSVGGGKADKRAEDAALPASFTPVQ